MLPGVAVVVASVAVRRLRGQQERSHPRLQSFGKTNQNK